MKKLLLVLTTLLSVSAFAQKAMTLTLLSPMANQIVHKNDSFEVKATLTNSGTDTIMSTDTIISILTIASHQASSVLVLGHNDMVAGSSVIISLGYYPGSILYSHYNKDTTLNICLLAEFLSDTIGSSTVEGCNVINYVNTNVGVKELAAAKSLQVYPNPAVDVLNITFNYAETSHITIMDITGRTVKTMPIENGSAKVNVSDMAKGVYLYSITTNDGQLIKSGKFSVSR